MVVVEKLIVSYRNLDLICSGVEVGATGGFFFLMPIFFPTFLAFKDPPCVALGAGWVQLSGGPSPKNSSNSSLNHGCYTKLGTHPSMLSTK